jgi:hypothetical protein
MATINDVPSAAPPYKTTGPEVKVGVPVQVPFRKKANTTVPVGVGPEPVTVTESCTVDPANTWVTT